MTHLLLLIICLVQSTRISLHRRCRDVGCCGVGDMVYLYLTLWWLIMFFVDTTDPWVKANSKLCKFLCIFWACVPEDIYIRVSQKNTFSKKIKSGTHHASAWGLVWTDPKGFLILTKFKAASSHLKFELFPYFGGGGGGVILPSFNLSSCCVSEPSSQAEEMSMTMRRTWKRARVSWPGT